MLFDSCMIFFLCKTVPISVVASTKKMKSLISNNHMLAQALRSSSKLVSCLIEFLIVFLFFFSCLNNISHLVFKLSLLFLNNVIKGCK